MQIRDVRDSVAQLKQALEENGYSKGIFITELSADQRSLYMKSMNRSSAPQLRKFVIDISNGLVQKISANS